MHRTLRAPILVTILVLLMPLPTPAADLQLAFADGKWNGESVPEGEQCQKFEGHGVTPQIHVSAIPSGANALVLEFSDRSYQPMDNGGHGKLGYEIEPGTAEVTVPSAPGHTTELPPGFFVVSEHQAPTWDKPGAYLPPCSGGRGNSYYVTVKAVHRMDDESHELASGQLEMGKY